MLLPFVLIAIFFFGLGIYMLILGKYTIMSTLFVLAFISYVIGSLINIKQNIKNVNFAGLGIEFKNEEQRTFVDVATELLENNFPILSKVGEEEVNKRVSSWIKEFLTEIEKRKIPIGNTKLFYEPNFQFVLNKAIETVARKNDNIVNETLIMLLINRMEYNDSDDLVYLNQIDSVIIHDMPKFCEAHFKMLSSIVLFENLSKIVKCDNLECFYETIIPLLEHFVDKDVKCYFDIENSILAHCNGNTKLQTKKNGLSFSNDKSIYESDIIFTCFWDYISNEYPFLVELSKEDKEKLINNEILKCCETNFNRIYRYTLLSPICYTVVNKYFHQQLELFN